MTGRRWGNRPPDLRVLGLLTAQEAAARLGRHVSVRRVRALAAAGELERVRLGRLVRYTPGSVAAYRRRQQAGAGRAAEKAPRAMARHTGGR